MLTPEEKSEKIKLENSSSFEITINNQKYKLIISYNAQLICFEIEKLAQLPKTEYYLYLNMEQLSKINGFFRAFDSIPDIVASLKNNIIEKNNLSIFEEGNNMKIKIINPLSNNPFFIEIPSKEKNLRDEMKSISNYIINVKNELIEKIKEGNEKIKQLEEKVEELMKFKKDYEIIKKEEINQENRYFSNSNIVKFEDENMIINWFEKKPLKFWKLFDSKENGDSIQTFYNLCQYKPPLIIFIKTLNGYRFGGFTSVNLPNRSYSNKYCYGQDNKSFIFSIDKKEKYDIDNDKNYYQYATYYYFDSGNNEDNRFQFGQGDIFIYDNFTMKSKNQVSGRTYKINNINQINGGERYFIVESFEAYQLEYKNE